LSSLNNIKKGLNKHDPSLTISIGTSRTKEDHFRKVQELLLFKETLDRLKENLKDPSRLSQLKTNDFNAYKNYSEAMISFILNKINFLETKLQEFNEEKKESNLSLEVKSLKTLKKISYLTNLNKSYLWSLKETFETYSNINRQETNLFFNQVNRQATLPVSSSTEVYIKELLIGSNSKGIVGSPKGGNNKITNLLDGNLDAGFSFYSVENSKVELNLVVNFSQEEVVNFICIKLPEYSKRKLSKIEDISFIKKNGEKTSIKSLNSFSLNFISENSFELVFFPFVCEKIELKFKQEKQYFEDNVGYNQIDLDYISFRKLKFDKSGKISSRELSLLGENYLSASLTLDTYPRDKSYTLKSYLDTDKETVEAEEVNVFKSYPSYVKYTVNLEKVDDVKSIMEEETRFSYENASSYFNPEEEFFLEKDLREYTSTIKAAHIVKDTFIESRKSNSFYLGFKQEDVPKGLKLALRKVGELQALSSVPEDGIIRNDSITKTSLDFCFLETNISYKDNRYYFEIDEFLDLNNITLFNSESSEELEKNYQIELEENNIKSISFSNSDIEKFTRSTYSLSDLWVVDNIYSFSNQIIKNTLVFKDNLLDEFTETTFINGASEFAGEVSLFEEQITPFEITNGNQTIAFELSKEAISSSNASVYFQGDLLSAVIFEASVNPSGLIYNQPKIDTSSNVLYIKTSETDFFANYTVKYSYASQTVTNQKLFSVDYFNGNIYFSTAVDKSKRISFESSKGFGLKFTLALYKGIIKGSNFLRVKPGKSPLSSLSKNMIKIYLGKVNSIIDIEDINEYYSPIISKIGLDLT